MGCPPCWPCTAGSAPTSTSPLSSAPPPHFRMAPWPPSDSTCPGSGPRPPPPEPWGSEEYARHLLPLFDEPGALADRIVLVGPLLRWPGGRPPGATGAATGSSGWCSPACPCSTARAVGRGPLPAYRVARTLHRLGLVGEERMEALRQKYGSPDYRAAQGVMRDVFVQLLAEQYAEQMAAIDCPVDLVWGERRHRGAARGGGTGPDPVPVGPAGGAARRGPSDPHRGPAGSGRVIVGRAGTSPDVDPAQDDPAPRTTPPDDGTPRPGPPAPRCGLDHRGRLRAGLRARRPPVAPGGPAGALPGRVGHPVRRPVVAVDPGSTWSLAVVIVAAAVVSVRWPLAGVVAAVGGGGRAARAVAAGTDLAAGLDPAPADSGRWSGPLLEIGGGGGRGGAGTGGSRRRPGRAGRAPPGRPGLPGHRSGGATSGHPLRGRCRRPAGPGRPDRGGRHRLVRQDLHQGPHRPPGTATPGRWWPPRPASTTGPAWPGPSTSTWPRAPRCSWPRWAPTVRGRSPTCAGGARPTSR